MKLETRMQGVEELNKVFSNLPRSMQNKAYYRALLAGAGVVRDSAQKNVQSVVSNEATGALAKNLRVYRLKKRRGLYRVAVRVRKGAVNAKKRDGQGNPVRIGLYGSVLEYGKKGQAPRSWIRKAIREERTAAVYRIASDMQKRMLEALNDAKNKAGVGGARYKI